jgi:outer membrane receptor protein involved in Fe transport
MRPAVAFASIHCKPLLLGGTALAAVLLCAPGATAQTQASPASAPVANANGNGNGNNGVKGEAGPTVSEIVITATRQNQTLSKVPISVSAFTEDKMDQLGVKSFADLVRFTPGVTFDPTSKDISIRGVASTAGAATTGIYIDDTPIQVHVIGFNSDNTLPAVFDLDRVEVLRGPQGTLFGAGSEGGTVRYITPQPSLTTYSAYVRSEGSSTDGGQGSGEFGAAVGGPIVDDVLGFRVSAWYRHDGGWINRVDQATGQVVSPDSNSEDTFVARAALTWAPIANLTITPSLYEQIRNQHDYDFYWVGISNPSTGSYQNGDPESLPDPDHWTLPSLRIEYDFPGVSLISNTSYFWRKEVGGYEGTLYNLSYFQQLISTPGSCGACTTGGLYPLLTPTGFNLPGFGRYSSPNTVTNKQNNITQEIRLQSSNPKNRLVWVAGVFFQQNRQLSVEEIHDPQLEQITQYLFGESAENYWGEGLLGNDDYINYDLVHSRQIAVFGDATFAITPQLKLEGGLRYAQTSFNYTYFTNGAQNGGYTPCASSFCASGTPGTGQETEYPLTPKASLQYQMNRDNLFYATYSKGYREGGGSPQVSPTFCAGDLAALGLTQSPPAYHSDTVDSYELGSKNKFLDRKLQLEGSVYYLQWHNIQQEILLPDCGYQYTGNLGEAVSKGFDLQIQYQVIQNLDTELAVGYTDAKYVKTAYSGGSILANSGDAIGTPYAAPPWTVSLGTQYNFRVLDHAAFARADVEYSSHNGNLTPALDPATSNYFNLPGNPPATTFVSLRSGMAIKGAQVSVFIDNLLNTHPGLNLTHEDQYTVLFQNTTFRPRTVGVTATYRY